MCSLKRKKLSNRVLKDDIDVKMLWEGFLRDLDKQFPLENEKFFEENSNEKLGESNLGGVEDLTDETIVNSDFSTEGVDLPEGWYEVSYEEEMNLFVITDDDCHKRLGIVHRLLEAFYLGGDIVPRLLEIDPSMDTKEILQLFMEVVEDWFPKVQN